MRYFFICFFLAVVTILGVAGFRGSLSRRPPIELFPDLDRQPKLRPQTANEFFANSRSIFCMTCDLILLKYILNGCLIFILNV